MNDEYHTVSRTQAISIAGGVIHKTIVILHHVTTQVLDKDKYHWKQCS